MHIYVTMTTEISKNYNSPLCVQNALTSRIHRSVPPVHKITTLEARQLRTAPAPTPMTQLPDRRQHRKLLAKVVGFDATLLEPAKLHHSDVIHSPR